ncbi:MAG: hypothetical protein LUO93_10480 [Methanomicrobiales archaeon]|nr:hypothetical protein [Methanomicrobiales archaeon]
MQRAVGRAVDGELAFPPTLGDSTDCVLIHQCFLLALFILGVVRTMPKMVFLPIRNP